MQQAQMHVPPLSKVNKVIIGIYVGTFILNSIMGQSSGGSLAGILGLSMPGLTSGFIFQIITYPFIDFGLIHVVFNALILWFIGSELEQRWGQKFYLKFLGFTVLAGALGYIGIHFLLNTVGVLNGLTGVNLALFVAYALIFSERTLLFMLIFPMKAKYFCMLLAAIEIYMGMFSQGGSIAAWSHIASMAFGFVYLKVKSLQARGVTLSAIKAEYHRNKMRRKLKLVDDEEPETPPDKPDPKNPKYWQ